MLDLYKAEQVMGRFKIRSRGQNRPVPFRMNPSQKKITERCIEHCRKGHRMYVIFLKARRLGVTTYVRGMCQCHLMQKEYADAIVMAQNAKVARSIYQDSIVLAKQLPLLPSEWKTTREETNFFTIPSKLSWNTANSVVGTRGLAYTHLHATEAAFYENSEVFTAVLSTLSDDPENMAFIETTANGTEGPGQAYHDLWQAAVAGENEFLPIFLPWHDDPEYVRPEIEAKDAPQGDYEKYLMKDLKLGRERIAYFRYALANKCSNRLDKWRREYPGTPEEAFEVTGVPVFGFDDVTTARATQEEPLDVVEISMAKHRHGTQAKLEHRHGARFHIYEKPQQGAHYFMGVTVGAAGGPDEDDSIAAVVWNGETGRLAGRFVDTLYPATASELICGFGTLFNMAMINVNQGEGGFGTQISQELRDRWHYRNPYRWKGRNDRVSSNRAGSTVGFSINDYTRKMLLNGFIAALQRDEVSPVDEMFLDQMPSAQWEAYYPFEAVAGDDDVLWAGLLGWIARSQHHPKKCESWTPSADTDLYDDAIKAIPHQKSPFATSMMRRGCLEDGYTEGMTLQRHLDQRDKKEREYAQIN